MTRWSIWGVAAALLVCAAASWFLRPTAQPDPDFSIEQLVPTQFAGWKVDPSIVPVAPSPDVQANLETLYDQILTRTYVNEKGQRIMLVIAYGGDQSDSLKAHRQEVCYQAQGFAIRSVRNDSLHADGGAVPVVRVHAQQGRRSEPISYWFTMGDYVVMGRAERLATQVMYGLRGRIPDGMLVRVSNISGDPETAYASHDEFLRALLATVGPNGRQRLAGLMERAG